MTKHFSDPMCNLKIDMFMFCRYVVLFIMNIDVPNPASLQVLEEDSRPAGALCRLQRLSLLLCLQRKTWDEAVHPNASRLLCSQRHMAHCCQGEGVLFIYLLPYLFSLELITAILFTRVKMIIQFS